MNEPTEGGRLTAELDADLAERLRVHAGADRRSVDAAVADTVEEYLGTHPNREQVRAAGLVAVREYETEYGPFTEEEPAAADARIDWLFGPGDGDQGDPPAGGPPDGRDV